MGTRSQRSASRDLTNEEIAKLRKECLEPGRGGQGTSAPTLDREQILRLLDEIERRRRLRSKELIDLRTNERELRAAVEHLERHIGQLDKPRKQR